MKEKIDWRLALENIETNCHHAVEAQRSRPQSKVNDDLYRVALALELVGEIIRPLVARVEALEEVEAMDSAETLLGELARRIRDLLLTNRGVDIVPEAIEATLDGRPRQSGNRSEPLKLAVKVASVAGSEEGVAGDDEGKGGYSGQQCVTYQINTPCPQGRRRVQLSLRFLLSEDPNWKIGQKIKLTIEGEP